MAGHTEEGMARGGLEGVGAGLSAWEKPEVTEVSGIWPWRFCSGAPSCGTDYDKGWNLSFVTNQDKHVYRIDSSAPCNGHLRGAAIDPHFTEGEGRFGVPGPRLPLPFPPPAWEGHQGE